MERNVTYVDVSHTCLSSALLSRDVILIVPITEYRYRFEVWNVYLEQLSESYSLFCQREFDAKPLPVALEMTGWPSYGFRRLSTGIETSASLITYNLPPLQTRRHCGFVASSPPLRRRSRGGGENCLADNRRMWSINCIVTCMSFSLSTRYFHRLPPEVALMGNVDRAQKR